MRTRVWVAAIAAVVLAAAALGVVFFNGDRYRNDGPLRSDSENNIAFSLPAGVGATWGMVLPRNPTLADIVLRQIDPVDVVGLDVIGIGVNDPEVVGQIANAFGFPPAGVPVSPPDGVILPRVGSAHPELQVMVGIRLKADAGHGTIGGLRVRYATPQGSYEVTLPWSVDVDPSSA
jgi:hypothetical protein